MGLIDADALIAEYDRVHVGAPGGARKLMENAPTIEAAPERARPMEEWDEDYGDVLWWKIPIEEPPYVGSPLDENWPAYHTHWTPIPIPEQPKGE